MLTTGIQDTPQMDDAFPIELESRDRRATRRGQANDHRAILAPRIMVAPMVLTRMKQGDSLIANRVNRSRFYRLMSVTSLAGQCKIVSESKTTRLAWKDVLDNERLRRIFGRTAAVFTVSSRTCRDESSQNGGDIPLSHDPANAR
jgi:hypothetical protein